MRTSQFMAMISAVLDPVIYLNVNPDMLAAFLRIFGVFRRFSWEENINV